MWDRGRMMAIRADWKDTPTMLQVELHEFLGCLAVRRHRQSHREDSTSAAAGDQIEECVNALVGPALDCAADHGWDDPSDTAAVDGENTLHVDLPFARRVELPAARAAGKIRR